MKVLTASASGIGAVARVVALASVLLASCGTTDVGPTAPRRPPLAENCPVQLFPGARPTYPTVESDLRARRL